MNKKKNLPLFWYSLYRFKPDPQFLTRHWFRRIADKEKENYGDLISKYLYKKITGEAPIWYNPASLVPRPHYLTVGSILNFAKAESIVWGSGIINVHHDVINCDFRAVRGPATRKRLLELGYECPEVYGDPCLLLPEFYNPEIQKSSEIGVIPHFYDYKIIKEAIKDPTVKIIKLLTSDVEKTTREILSCKKIISSSLHGIIAAHAYGIPAVWIKFSDKLSGDGIKFQDYFSSVGIEPYHAYYWKKPEGIDKLLQIFDSHPNLPEDLNIQILKAGLLSTCPFKKVN